MFFTFQPRTHASSVEFELRDKTSWDQRTFFFAFHSSPLSNTNNCNLTSLIIIVEIVLVSFVFVVIHTKCRESSGTQPRFSFIKICIKKSSIKEIKNFGTTNETKEHPWRKVETKQTYYGDVCLSHSLTHSLTLCLTLNSRITLFIADSDDRKTKKKRSERRGENSVSHEKRQKIPKKYLFVFTTLMCRHVSYPKHLQTSCWTIIFIFAKKSTSVDDKIAIPRTNLY